MKRRKVKTYFSPVNLKSAKKAKRGFAFFERKSRKNRLRLAALSVEYAEDGRIANAAYDSTWRAALALIPSVRDGTLTPDEAIERLPEIKW